MEKILLVEDDQILLGLYSIFLRKDFDVSTASNGEEAIKKFLETKIDIVLTDIKINGGMNGFQFAKKIKSISPETPIIAMTGFDKMEEESDVFLKILKKPIKKNELIGELINL